MYFFLPIASFLAGVFLRSLVPVPLAALGLPILLGFGFLVAYFARRQPAFLLVSVCIIMGACGIARAALAPHALPEQFDSLVGGQSTLTGTIVQDPDLRETSQRLTVRITKGGTATRVIAVVPPGEAYAFGETVRISGAFTLPAPFATDGGRTFEYDKYLAMSGVFALVQPAQASVIAPPSGVFTRAVGALYVVKHAFSHGLDNALPEPEAGLAEGIIAGGKQGLGKALLASFTIAGIVQIVVLSGYNVMIVAEAIMKGLSWLPKRISFSAAALGIIAFVVAAGSGSSAMRAGVMACLALFARASGRTYNVMRALCFAIALMVLWNPLLLAFDPSFQLSCMATFGLILGVPVVEPWFGWIRNALVRGSVVTTIAAECAVLPLLLYETGNLSLVSVPANVTVSFLVPSAMAMSAIAGVAGALMPVYGSIIALPAYALLWLIVSIAEWAAALPYAQVIVPAFSWTFVVLAYAFLGWLAIRAKRNQERTPASAGVLPLLPAPVRVGLSESAATPARAGTAPRTPPS